MGRGICLWLGLLMAGMSVPASAQNIGVISSPILTLDQERLFVETGVSDLISVEIERRRAILAEENRRIESELGAEELALTEQRATMDPMEFRALADAFDERVQVLRAAQDAKGLQLQQMRDDERQNFLRRVTPILAEIVRERNALLVIDRRAAILSADAIDITEITIERMKIALAPPKDPEGPIVSPLPDSEPEPGTEPIENPVIAPNDP